MEVPNLIEINWFMNIESCLYNVLLSSTYVSLFSVNTMSLIIPLWNDDPFKCSGFPDKPLPFSPVQRALKFSAVLGTTLLNNSITIRPTVKIKTNNPVYLFQYQETLQICIDI